MVELDVFAGGGGVGAAGTRPGVGAGARRGVGVAGGRGVGVVAGGRGAGFVIRVVVTGGLRPLFEYRGSVSASAIPNGKNTVNTQPLITIKTNQRVFPNPLLKSIIPSLFFSFQYTKEFMFVISSSHSTILLMDFSQNT